MLAEQLLRSEMKKKIVIIPARMDSKRLPGKPMLKAAGKPLVQWTYEQAKRTDADHVIVATADTEIAHFCERVGMVWMLTQQNHPNGTSRIAEVYRKLKLEVRAATSVVVNWQVDEPLVRAQDANRLMVFRMSSIGTLVCRELPNMIGSEELFVDGLTRVVWSRDRCYWFSRAPMQGSGGHVGLYSFSPFVLQLVSSLLPSWLSEQESLEQLSWLEAKFVINPVEIEHLPLSINTPSDWESFKQMKEN